MPVPEWGISACTFAPGVPSETPSRHENLMQPIGGRCSRYLKRLSAMVRVSKHVLERVHERHGHLDVYGLAH